MSILSVFSTIAVGYIVWVGIRLLYDMIKDTKPIISAKRRCSAVWEVAWPVTLMIVVGIAGSVVAVAAFLAYWLCIGVIVACVLYPVFWIIKHLFY